jgi:hypothetical protein
LTPNHSADWVGDELRAAFLAKARAEGLTNTDAMRKMIRAWTGQDSSGPGSPG